MSTIRGLVSCLEAEAEAYRMATDETAEQYRQRLVLAALDLVRALCVEVA